MNVCSQMSLSAIILMSPLRKTHLNFLSQWLVEINSHPESPAVVSDALFIIIQSKS